MPRGAPWEVGTKDMPIKSQGKQDLPKGKTSTASIRPLGPACVANLDAWRIDTTKIGGHKLHHQGVLTKLNDHLPH